MKTKFDKPTIAFPSFPFINMWIEFDYQCIETFDDAIRFIHKGLEIIENNSNEVATAEYKKVVYPLYSMMTDRSYESKLLINKI